MYLPASIGELAELGWEKAAMSNSNNNEISDIQFTKLKHKLNGYSLEQLIYTTSEGEKRVAHALLDTPLSNDLPTKELIDFFEKNRLVGFAPKLQNIESGSTFKLRKFYQGPDFQKARLVNLYSRSEQLYWAFNYSKPEKDSSASQYLGLFKMEDNLRFKLQCEIKTQPEAEKIKQQQQEIPILSDYLQTIAEIMGGSGSHCRESKAAETAKHRFLQASKNLLYRPWATPTKSKNRDKTVLQLEEALEKWRFSGLWNYRKYQQFEQHRARAMIEVSQFIARNFSLPATKADEMSRQALDFLLLESLTYGEVDDKYHQLHRLVLEGKIEKMAAYSLPKDIDKNKNDIEFVGDDSLLVYALGQPELLQLLLQKGLNANKGNVFNKTALMYAAQFNDIDSAKLLLEHGADTNIATSQASDTCYYNIKTQGLTALHYAARYASKQFMDLLITHGALTSAKNSKGQTPSDYLKLYRTQTIAKKNGDLIHASALSTQSLQVLESTLAPAAKSTTNEANQANIQGEELLKQNKNRQALKAFRRAIALDENHFRAKSNFSSAALRLDRFEDAAKVATEIIQSEASTQDKSTANFNLALACEYNAKKNGYHFASIEFDSKMYCYPPGKTAIDYFLEAYRLYPTEYKLQRLQKFMSEGDDAIIKRVCKPTSTKGLVSIYLSVNHIYFFMEKGENLPYKSVSTSATEEINILEKKDFPLGDKFKVIRWRASKQPASLDILFDNGDSCKRVYN